MKFTHFRSHKKRCIVIISVIFVILAFTMSEGVIATHPSNEIHKQTNLKTAIQFDPKLTDIVTAFNSARSQSSLNKLSENTDLDQAASRRAQEMIRDKITDNNTGNTFGNVTDSGYTYANVSLDFVNGATSIEGTINSLKTSNFTQTTAVSDIGVGIQEVDTNTYLVVIYLASPKATQTTQQPSTVFKGCTTASIPYITSTQYSSSIPNGQQEITQLGINGYMQTCGTIGQPGYKVYSQQPTNKIVVIGTGMANSSSTSPAVEQPGISAGQAQSNCSAKTGNDSSAFNQCMRAYGY